MEVVPRLDDIIDEDPRKILFLASVRHRRQSEHRSHSSLLGVASSLLPV